jgi:uncharacterized protein (UPF0303 family)
VVVAVADGRLSIAPGSVSLDSAEKISRIRPEYRYPLSTMGTVERSQAYHMYDWCFMYAGTYALASEIRDAFRKGVTSLLVDRLDNGDVDFVAAWSGSHRGNDEFYIHNSELPKIPSRIIVDELRRAYQSKGDEWMTNRSLIPDVEFILFGTNEETREYEAYVAYLDQAHTTFGNPIAVKVEPVSDMSVVAIGSRPEAAKIVADSQLSAAILNSVPPASAVETLDSFFDEIEPSRTSEVVERMLELAAAAALADPNVGGELLLAVGTSSHDIKIVQAK